MKINSISIYIASTLALLSTANASYITNKKVIKAPITRINRPDPIISSIQKRNNLEKRDPFTASLYNDAGSQYLIEVNIGTPAQSFYVTLDTGSADLWVPGRLCSSTECPNGFFDASQSSTFKSLNRTFSLTYGIGSVNGTYVTDTVSIAGATVNKQQFGLASSTQQILTNPNTITSSLANTNTSSTSFQNIKSFASSVSETPVANGILGMGYPKLTAASSKGQGAYNPFVFNLVSQKIISDPVFSIYLNRVKEEGWAGEIIFGGVDPSKYKGNLTYLPVMSLASVTSKKRDGRSNNYYWMVGAQGISVTSTTNTTSIDTNNTTSSSSSTTTTANNNSSSPSNILDIEFSSVGAFILDTGTTLTYFPSTIAQQIVEAIAGPDGYTLEAGSSAYLVDCNTAKSQTQLELKMTPTTSRVTNPVTLSIPASQLVIPLNGATADDASYCLFGIAPSSSTSTSSDSNNNLHLVGDSILRSAYLVFDIGNNQIGLAAAVGVEGSVKGISSTSFEQSTSGGIGKLDQHPTIFALISCLFIIALAF